MPTKMILDCDTGTDDAVALMVAALHPDIALVAATCVNGSVPTPNVVENTLRVFDMLGAAIPVHPGCSAPLSRVGLPVPPRSADSKAIHGEHLEQLPPATSKPAATHAVSFLLDYFAAEAAAGAPAADRTVVVAVGPLTNLATALKVRPSLAQEIPRLVIMGGGHDTGNRTPSAEFNFWSDPLAARVVLNSGAAITLVPLDCTHHAEVSLADCAALQALGTPAAAAAAAFAEQRTLAYKARQADADSIDGAPLHDPVAAMSVAVPAVLQAVRDLPVDVETVGELTSGRTVMDMRGRGVPANCTVAFDCDKALFLEVLAATLARPFSAAHNGGVG